jgi:hypothetical protein
MPFDNNSAYQARRELAILSELIAEATTARDEAQQTYDRLAKPASLLEEAVTQHAAEKAIHDAQLVVWYNNGCIGERPSTPSSLLLAEHRIGEARRDLGASATALEIAMSGLRAASEHLAELHLRYRGALYRAAVEAAAWRLQTRAAPVLIAALNEFAGVESVQTELRNRGFGPDPHPEALSASREIGRLISTVRQSIGVRGDLQRARQFLDELASNPEATLPDPGEPIVELIEPRMEKPMVDGSQFLNRSTPEEQVSGTRSAGLAEPGD